MSAFRRGVVRLVQILAPRFTRRLQPVPVPKPVQRSSARGSKLGSLAIIASLVTSAMAQMPPAIVKIALVEEREVTAGQTFVGTVMPLRQSTVGSAVDGRVIEFFVNEGDAVKKDQPMAQLRTGTLEIELAGAKATVQLRESELAELRNGTRAEDIEQTRARMASAEARREYTQHNLERTEQLYNERRAISLAELQDATSLAEQASQSYLEAKAAHELAVAGPRAEQIAQAEANLAVASEQARLIEDRLEKHTIRAPFDGYVTAEHMEVGQWVQQAGPIVDVVELHHVDIEVMVLEQYVENLRPGDDARLDITALPNHAFTGDVALIVPQADVRSRSFPVKVRVENTIVDGTPLLMPGMFARATLPVGKPEKATLVPKDAVVLGGPTPVVWTVDSTTDKTGKARQVPVQLGIAAENLIQVIGPLKAGNTIIVEGNERLRPMQEVTF
jgi:multidrug efflux pump subunit AcrA (membrane-fusion protein)